MTIRGVIRRAHPAQVLVLCSLLLSACSSGAPAPAAASAPAPKPTSAPAATTAPPAPAQAPTAVPVAKPTTAPPTAAKPAEKEDLAALYEGAKKEGVLNFYTTINADVGQEIVAKFTARYPGVKVNYNRQSGVKLDEVMAAEAKAGRMEWDVVETGSEYVLGYVKAGYLQPYRPSSAESFPPELRDPNGMWVSERVNSYTVSVNTNLVKPEAYPKAWDDVLKPEWQGKLAVEETNVIVYTAMKDAWGAEKATAWWKGVAANNPSIRSGNTQTAQLLGAGEFAMTANISTNEAHRLEEKKGPVRVIPLDPIFTQLQMIGLGAKPPHPNAAKLFINWLLDDEGQRAIMNGYTPSRPDLFKQAMAYLGEYRIRYISPEVAATAKNDIDDFRKILGI